MLLKISLIAVGFIVLLIASLIIGKTKRILQVTGSVIVLGTVFLPQLFARKIVLSQLNESKISHIVLTPSSSEYEVNLIDDSVLIRDKNTIDSIVYYLKHSDNYSVNHPIRKWETNLVLITKDQDSIKLKVNKTDNNGTIIINDADDYREDKLSGFLERVSGYTGAPMKKRASGLAFREFIFNSQTGLNELKKNIELRTTNPDDNNTWVSYPPNRSAVYESCTLFFYLKEDNSLEKASVIYIYFQRTKEELAREVVKELPLLRHYLKADTIEVSKMKFGGMIVETKYATSSFQKLNCTFYFDSLP